MPTETSTDATRELLGPILDAIPGSVFWKDREGVFLGANQCFADDAGFATPEDLVGKTDYDMIWRDHAELYRADDREVMETGVAKTSYEEPHTASDGRTVWVRTSKVPLRSRMGDIIGVLGTYIDITEQRRVAARLEEKGRLEAVGRLAGGVAHDFNNLLTAIRGAVDLVEKSVPPMDPGHGNLQTIRDAASRAAHLTSQLLAFARREVMLPRAIDPNALLEESGSILRSLLGEHIELYLDLSPDAWPITLDPSQFQRVLLNLAANARDAMTRGGRFCIETRNVALDSTVFDTRPDVRPGEYLELKLTDDGAGIAEDNLCRLFEPFFTTKKHGTGLGLATSHGLVKQCGGDIWVESQLGKGATFRVLFPRSHAAVAPPESEPAPVVGDPVGTVLLVEDDSVIRTLTTAGLSQRGFVVHATDSLVESATVAQTLEAAGERIDVVVCDVLLPDARGPEVAELVRRHHPGCTVLYVSGYTADTVMDDGILKPDSRFLAKPYSLDELVGAIGATRGAAG